MVQTKVRFESFEEYLAYDDGTDYLYELFNGELVALPPKSGRNFSIAGFLFMQFASILGHQRVRGHGLELEVRGEPRNRFPDLTILREEHIEQLQRRNTIRLSMASPLLVVEIVSPGDLQHDRDYIAKKIQYQDRAVLEYWIIDPQTEEILQLSLTETGFTETTCRQDDRLRSQFAKLDLTAAQVFAAGQ